MDIGNEAKKRKLCEPCQNDKQRKNTKYTCAVCGKYLCLSHITVLCKDCNTYQNSSLEEDSAE